MMLLNGSAHMEVINQKRKDIILKKVEDYYYSKRKEKE